MARLLLALIAALALLGRARADLVESEAYNSTACDGSEAEEDICYIATSTFPRQCDCVRNTCLPGGIANTLSCFICNRGYGVYRSYEECIGNAAFIEAAGIDPSSYPPPSFPATACPANTPAGGQDRQNCPFWQSGLRRWDDPATWGGRVPSPSDVITLPASSRVLLGACMLQRGATYKQIVVPAGSELILADEDMELDVGSIVLLGALRVGSPTCRLTSRITFTFHRVPGIDPFNMAIWVRQGGQLDLHGKLFTPTWTRLAQTAMAATSYLVLQDAVNWEPGQQLVVTTTIWKDEQENQNEVHTVASLSADRRTVYLQRPLQYQHYGGPEYQAEVALLSRNILVQGDSSVQPRGVGPHVRVEGQARIRGVEAYRAGQYNVKGAYPFHFHFAGDASASAVTDCSVYNSNYRCYVVHATSSLLLQNNVGFHATGHCFYLEDGVEEYNTLDHNLAAFVHVIGQPAAGYDQTGQTFVESASLTQPTDSAASGFYALNPNNRWTNNAASGGYAGFLFPVAPRPIGDSRWQNIVPASRPLLRFDGNSAHSSSYMWFQAGCFYFGGKVWEDANSNNRVYYNSGRNEFTTMDAAGKNPAFFQLTNNKVFLCMVGHMSWGQRFEVVGFQAYDVVRGTTLFGQGLVKNAYISQTSANTKSQWPGPLDDLPPIAGFQWYDTRTMTVIKDTTYVNYKYRPELGWYRPAVFYSMTHSDEYKPMGMSSTSNITYINVDHAAIGRLDVKETGSSRMFNWIDYDGTSSQRTGPTIVGAWPSWWQIADDCSYENTWNSWVCPKRAGVEVGRVEIRIPGVTVAWDSGKAVPPTPDNQIGYVALFGYRGNAARKMTITKNEGVTGVTGTTGWYAHYSSGAPKYHEIWLSQVPVGTSIIYATRYPAGSSFTVRRTFRWYSSLSRDLRQVSSLDQVVSGDGTTYYFNGHHLYVKLVDPGNQETQGIDFTRDGVTVRGYRYWSLYYSITLNTNNCGTFCWMQDQWDDIPDAIGAPAAGGTGSGSCTDTQPNDGTTCALKKSWGQCSADWMRSAGWCSATCGRCTPAPAPAPAASAAPTGCIDVQPTDGTTCSQQSLWGKCGEPWMASSNWCAATCGRCSQPAPQVSPTACSDIQPPGGFSCAQQKAWGKCSDPWLRSGGFCLGTCGLCSVASACTDNVPPGGFSCAQQKAWGKCSEPWIRSGGYCSATCGLCSGAGASVQSVEGAATIESVGGVQTEEGPAPCVDTPPPGLFSCREQKAWGMCPAMEGTAFCAITCGRCQPQQEVCTDTPTPDGVPCVEKKAQGKCGEPYLEQGGYCQQTCGVCGAVSIQAVQCTDVPTPDGNTCKDLRMGGQCDSAYIMMGSYCNLSCGRCNATEAAPPPAAEADGGAAAPSALSLPPGDGVSAANGPGGRRLLDATTA